MHPYNYYLAYNNLSNIRIIFAQSMIYITLLLNISTTAHGPLIGFDCDGQHLNITSVSLLGAGDCNLRYKTPNVTNVYISYCNFPSITTRKCYSVKWKYRTIYHCGMHSHISAINNGQIEYLLETGYTRCRQMLIVGPLSLGVSSIVNGLKPTVLPAALHLLELSGTAAVKEHNIQILMGHEMMS